MWWLQIGIRHERIDKGKPQQDGRLERFHRTLELQTMSPPRLSMEHQQRAFDAFLQEYNELRPHEALGQRTPSHLYTSSGRRYQRDLDDPHYDANAFIIRRVDNKGRIKVQGRSIFIADCSSNELVALRDTFSLGYELFFGDIRLGQLRPWYAPNKLVQPRIKQKRASGSR